MYTGQDRRTSGKSLVENIPALHGCVGLEHK